MVEHFLEMGCSLGVIPHDVGVPTYLQAYIKYPVVKQLYKKFTTFCGISGPKHVDHGVQRLERCDDGRHRGTRKLGQGHHCVDNAGFECSFPERIELDLTLWTFITFETFSNSTLNRKNTTN